VEKTKPVALNGIAFYNRRGDWICTESDVITFRDYEHMEVHIQARKKYWSELYNIDLTLSADNNETLKEKQVLDVLRIVCERQGVNYQSARSKYRGRNEVEARRFTIGICHGRKMAKTTIGKALGTDHANVIYHIEELQRLSDSDKEYRKSFLDTEDFVLIEIGGQFKEDGSGKKPKKDEEAKDNGSGV
jgi:hypothetical protein